MGLKKKIAFMCHPYHRGGVTRWMADAAIAASNDYEVYFVTVSPSVTFYSGEGRETLLQLINNAGEIHKIIQPVGREFEFGTPEYRAYIYSKLLLQVPAGTPVILADDYAVWAGAARYKTEYPMVGVLHADEEYYYDIASTFRQQVALFVCVSGRVSRKAQERMPDVAADRIFTIPCGINLPVPHFNTRDTGVLRLIYVGRVSYYQKRVGDLVKIGKTLNEQEVKFHLNIIGDGVEAKGELQKEVALANLEDNVSFLGWMSQRQVAAHMASSDILILTSDFEGMPIAMMEGLAMGCGFVGTRVSGIEDIEHHKNGENCVGIYEVGDIEAAVKQIMTIGAIPKDQRMVAARQLAEEEFTMQLCIKRYFSAIDQLPAVKTKKNPVYKMPLSSILHSRLLALGRSLKMRLRS
jgi:glycosyltransferase involved in cell wall biosynthesis